MKKIFFLVSLFFLVSRILIAQTKENLKLTLDDVIGIASRQSLDAFRNKNMFLASYWEFRNYKADRLPILSLESSPADYFRRINKVYNSGENKYEYVSDKSFGAGASLQLNQNIGLTGGSIFVRSDLDYLYDLDDEEQQWVSTPVDIGFRQQLNGYNRLRWESKLEPLKFQKAKMDFIQSKEELSVKATNLFFNLVTAQIELTIAENNVHDADTLYNVGQGRFNIGTVTQDELLNLELKLLNAQVALNRTQLQLQRSKAQLNSFLGVGKNIEIECIIPDEIPSLTVEVGLAKEMAFMNNPDILDQKYREINENRKVALAKSENGLNADLSASYGLNQYSSSLEEAYKNPLDKQGVQVQLAIPILDWGRRKGNLEMARSNREVVKATLEQERIDFEQDIFMNVMEFNLQASQVLNSAKADTVAQKGYEVTLQRFLIGKVDVTRLNIARDDKENSKRAYVDALKVYWNYYYNLRRLTLYDFVSEKTLSENFDSLIQRP